MPVDVSIRRLEGTSNELKFKWKLPDDSGYLTGTNMLAQWIAKSLLTTPGTDMLNPGWGGGLRSLLPTRIESNGNITAIDREKIFFAISKVESDIKSYQRSNPSRDTDSLKNLEVMSLDVSSDLSTVIISLKIMTADNIARLSTLEI